MTSEPETREKTVASQAEISCTVFHLSLLMYGVFLRQSHGTPTFVILPTHLHLPSCFSAGVAFVVVVADVVAAVAVADMLQRYSRWRYGWAESNKIHPVVFLQD